MQKKNKLKTSIENGKQKELKRILDVVFFVLFLAIGIVGLTVVYVPQSPYMSHVPSAYVGGSTELNIKDALPEQRPRIEVRGLEETNSTIRFKVFPFSNSYDYYIDFGDDNPMRLMTSESVRHQYYHADVYYVRVYRQQVDGERILLLKEKLNIAEKPENHVQEIEMPI